MDELSRHRHEKSHPQADVRLGRLAARQHGVVNRRQLVQLGIGDEAIRRRVEKGRLHRVHRGVYAVGHPGLTEHGRWMAAVVACGRGSVLSHFDAARLWGIYEARGPTIHVTTPHAGRARPGIQVHRARELRPDEVAMKEGIPVTSVARTLVDLAGGLPDHRLRRAIREAAYRQLLDPHALGAALERGRGRKGLRALKEAVELRLDEGMVRDELEHRFLELIAAAGVPLPETNVRVRTKRRTYTVDCLWRDERVALELDGRAAHARVEAFEEDHERDAAISAIGLRPLRYTWRRVTQDGAGVVAELRAVLEPQPSAPSSRSTRRRIARDDAYVESIP